MADQKISQLPQKDSLNSEDEIVIVDNDSTPVTKKITARALDTRFILLAIIFGL